MGRRREALLGEVIRYANKITNPQKEDSRREKSIAPSEQKAQALPALAQGQLEA